MALLWKMRQMKMKQVSRSFLRLKVPHLRQPLNNTYHIFYLLHCLYIIFGRTANALCKLCCHEPDNEQCSDGRCKNWNDLCITKPNPNGNDTNNPPNGNDTNNPGRGYSQPLDCLTWLIFLSPIFNSFLCSFDIFLSWRNNI